MHYLIDFCRLCLSLKGEFNNMWMDDIMEKVTACISELDFDSNLPFLICNRCLEKTEEFFEFRNQCLQSEFFINGYVDKLLNDARTCNNFISTVLKVNVLRDFGTSDKCKSNVKLRKSKWVPDEAQSNTCNVYLRDFLKPWQISSDACNVTDSKIPNEVIPVKDESLCHLIEVKPEIIAEEIGENSHVAKWTENSVNKVAITSRIDEVINLDGDDDVFIEVEEDYSIQEPELVEKSQIPNEKITQDVANSDIQDVLFQNTNNVDLHDPENLLIDNGQERADFDVQTDVSERVKLRRRNSRVKPIYRLDNNFFNAQKKDTAKKSTTGSKKSPPRKSNSKASQIDHNPVLSGTVSQTLPDVEADKLKVNRSQARKSTSKSWKNFKKSKVKIGSASRELWKAACRNWALQRMQTAGHVNTGSRNSLNTVRLSEFDGLKQYSQNQSPDSSKEPSTAQDICSLSNSIRIHHKKDASVANANTGNLSIATTVEYQDSTCDVADVNDNYNPTVTTLNATIAVTTANDTVSATAANDTISATTANNTISATTANDTISATTANDTHPATTANDPIVTNDDCRPNCNDATNDNCRPNCIDFLNKSIRPPRIKTVQELNELLEQEHQRFSENLSSEYGIVLDEDNYAGIVDEIEDTSKWDAFDEISFDTNPLKTPQILNTFSLSDSIWNPTESVADVQDEFNNSVIELQENFNIGNQRIIISSSYPTVIQQNAASLETHGFDAAQRSLSNNLIGQPILFRESDISRLEPCTEFTFATSLNQIVKLPKVYSDIAKTPEPHIKLKPLEALQFTPPKCNQRLDETMNQKGTEIKDTIEQTSNVTDFEGAITAHYIGNGINETKNTLPVRNPDLANVAIKPLAKVAIKSPKVTIKSPKAAIKSLPKVAVKTYPKVKSLSSLKEPPKQTRYKIKTTNNIILIDSGKRSSDVPAQEEKLYKSNFGNILKHYLKGSEEPTSNQNVTYRLSPIKLVVPRKYSASRKAKKKFKSIDVPSSSTSTSVLHTIKNNWTALKNGQQTTLKESSNNKAPELNISLIPLERALQGESNKEKAFLQSLVEETDAEKITLISADSLHSASVSSKNVQDILNAGKQNIQLKCSILKSLITNTPKTDKNDSEIIWIEDSPPPSTSMINEESEGFGCLAETPDNAATEKQIPNLLDSERLFSRTNASHDATSAMNTSLLSLKPFISQENLNDTDQVIEPLASSRRGTKRRFTADDELQLLKSIRSSSEESDNLVIDDLLRKSNATDQLESGTATKDTLISNFAENIYEGVTCGAVYIKEENNVILKNQTSNRLSENSSDPLNAESKEVADFSIMGNSHADDSLHGTSTMCLQTNYTNGKNASIPLNETSLNKKNKISANIASENPAPHKTTFNFENVNYLNVKSERSVHQTSDMLISAGLLCTLDNGTDRINQTSNNTSSKHYKITTPSSPNSNSFGESYPLDKSTRFLANLIECLESPPSSPRLNSTKGSRLQSKIVSKPSNVEGNSNILADSAKTKYNSALPKVCFQSSEDSSSLENTTTSSSHLIAPSLENKLDLSISSDSDSSYVDVEAMSGDEELCEYDFLPGPALTAHLENQCRKERLRRQGLNKNLKTLYDLIDQDYLAGKSLDAVLKSANSYIHSLELKSDKLDNEYQYLKAKHDYLIQTVAQLKKI